MDALFELPVLAFVVLRWAARRKRQGTIQPLELVHLQVVAAELAGLRYLLGNSWLERIVGKQIDKRMKAVALLISMPKHWNCMCSVIGTGIPAGGNLVVVNELGRNVLRSE